jgi:hypothetical protein
MNNLIHKTSNLVALLVAVVVAGAALYTQTSASIQAMGESGIAMTVIGGTVLSVVAWGFLSTEIFA